MKSGYCRLFVAAVGAAFLCALPLRAQQQPATHEVRLTDDFKFRPYRLTIAAGDTVLWKNASHFTHTVTADPTLARYKNSAQLPGGVEVFNSGNIPPQGTYEHAFSVPGKYRYFCIPHEDKDMVGEITVEAPAK